MGTAARRMRKVAQERAAAPMTGFTATEYAAIRDRHDPASVRDTLRVLQGQLDRNVPRRDRKGSAVQVFVHTAQEALESATLLRGAGKDDDPQWEQLRAFCRRHPRGAIVTATVPVHPDVTVGR